MPDRRRNDAAGKAGLGALGRELIRILRDGLHRADQDHGVTRRMVALKIGVEPRTIDAWLMPSHANVPRADVLFELLVRDDILPEPVRIAMLGRVCEQAGGSFEPGPDLGYDEEDVATGALRLAEEVGDFARAVRASGDARSPGGRAVTVDEWRKQLDILEELSTVVASAKRDVRRRMMEARA